MNSALVSQLLELGNIIEQRDGKKESEFRVSAYRRAAASISKLDYKITRANMPNLTSRKISGIGAGIVEKIGEFLDNGEISELAKLRNSPEVSAREELGKIVGVGPKILAKWIAHGIYNRRDLWKAVKNGEINLTSAQAIGLKYYDDLNTRIPRRVISEVFREISAYLPRRAEVAGSYRRGAKDSGDIDIIACGKVRQNLFDDIRTAAVLMRGEKRISIVWCSSRCMQVDILQTDADEFIPALQYFTGSAEHNEYLRGVAKKRGYKLNEKGLFHHGVSVKLRDEAQIYAILGVDYLPPESRG